MFTFIPSTFVRQAPQQEVQRLCSKLATDQVSWVIEHRSCSHKIYHRRQSSWFINLKIQQCNEQWNMGDWYIQYFIHWLRQQGCQHFRGELMPWQSRLYSQLDLNRLEINIQQAFQKNLNRETLDGLVTQALQRNQRIPRVSTVSPQCSAALNIFLITFSLDWWVKFLKERFL